MNNKYYEDIFEQFRNDHEYMVNDVEDWRPKGERGIRVTLVNGDRYDYNAITRAVRRVKEFNIHNVDDITEEMCRESISYHLTELMALNGFNQQTLAQYSGLSLGAINNYINGRATPSATALLRIAQAMNCDVTDLLY